MAQRNNDLDDYFTVNNIPFGLDFNIINYNDVASMDSVDEDSSFVMVNHTGENDERFNDIEDTNSIVSTLSNNSSNHSNNSNNSYNAYGVNGSDCGSSTASTKQLEFSLSAIRTKMEQKSLLKQLKEYNDRYNSNSQCHKRYKRYYKCYQILSLLCLIITFCIYCYWSYYYIYGESNYVMNENNDEIYVNEYDYDYEYDKISEEQMYYNQPHGHGFVHDYNEYNNQYNDFATYYNEFILYLWQMVIFIVMFIICFSFYQVVGFNEPTAKNE